MDEMIEVDLLNSWDRYEYSFAMVSTQSHQTKKLYPFDSTTTQRFHSIVQYRRNLLDRTNILLNNVAMGKDSFFILLKTKIVLFVMQGLQLVN